MQDEVKNPSSRKSGTLTFVCTLFIVYCLALGPILSGYMAIENAADFDLEPLTIVLIVVFYPHVIVAERFPAYEEYLEWWIELGGG